MSLTSVWVAAVDSSRKTGDWYGVTFASREAAGQELSRHLEERGIQPDVVLGLPRGGVVVAAEVARGLQKPLSVLVVRKIGHPHQREFAIGALAENDVMLLDETLLESPAFREELDEVVAEETAHLQEYQTRFHPRGKVSLAGKHVLLVDDGLATGATAVAAVMSAKKQNAREISVAVPVASPDGTSRLRAAGASVFALIVDPEFEAVGAYYDYFPQTADDEVVALLKAHA